MTKEKVNEAIEVNNMFQFWLKALSNFPLEFLYRFAKEAKHSINTNHPFSLIEATIWTYFFGSEKKKGIVEAPPELQEILQYKHNAPPQIFA